MSHKESNRKTTVRLTIDFPAEQHTYLKMLAAKEGISLRQFVIESLPSLDNQEKKDRNIEQDEFDKHLKKFLVKKANLMKRLADK